MFGFFPCVSSLPSFCFILLVTFLFIFVLCQVDALGPLGDALVRAAPSSGNALLHSSASIAQRYCSTPLLQHTLFSGLGANLPCLADTLCFLVAKRIRMMNDI